MIINNLVKTNILHAKLLILCLVFLLFTSCSSIESNDDSVKNTILGRYVEYVLVIENNEISQNSKDYFSEAFYDFAKDELNVDIDLTQRGIVQFTYIPLGNLKGYEFSVFGDLQCLKLNGIDINQRKISLLLDYVLEDGVWKINEYFAGYLDGGLPYSKFPPCTKKAIDSI